MCGLFYCRKMEEVEEKATKLADRLGLRKDYATVLLAENSWYDALAFCLYFHIFLTTSPQLFFSYVFV